MEIILLCLCRLTWFVWPVSVHVLSLLPTAHSPGCRWDALSSAAESVLCAALGSRIHSAAPPAITWLCLALGEREEKLMDYLEWVARMLCGVFLTAAASVRHQREQRKSTANRCFHPLAELLRARVPCVRSCGERDDARPLTPTGFVRICWETENMILSEEHATRCDESLCAVWWRNAWLVKFDFFLTIPEWHPNSRTMIHLDTV